MIAELLTPPAPNRLDYANKGDYEAAWRDWRRTGIGASDSAKVAGVAPKSYGSQIALQWSKLGLDTPDAPNVAMRRGNALEPLILELWEERFEETLAQQQLAIRHPDYPFMIATLDGVRQNGKLVEAKSMNGEIARYYKLGPDGDVQSLPIFWATQGQHQMACYGTDLVTFAVLVDDDFRCYDLYRDERVIQSLIEVEAAWWDKYVLQQLPIREYAASDADLIGRRFRGETGDHRDWSQANELLRSALAYETLTETISGLSKQLREAELERKAEKAEILDAMGDATSATLPMGYTITREVKKRGGYPVKPTSWVQIDVQSNLFQRSIA